MKRGLAFKGPAKQGGWIGIAISAVSAIAGATSASKAKKRQRRANKAQRKINRIRNFQAKRSFLKQFRQAQAQNLVAGLAAGVGLESSRVQGTRGSQLSQAKQSVAEFNLMDKLGAEQAAAMNKAARYQFQSGIYGQISNFALSFASMRAGPKPGGDAGGQQISEIPLPGIKR